MCSSDLLLMVVLLTGNAWAQAPAPQNVQAQSVSAAEREIQGEIICTCGCRLSVAKCGMPNCEGREAQSAKIHDLVAQGKTHDAVLATFVHDFGGEDILTAPIDKGFNRLAWMFPYLLGVGGAVAGAFAVVKWSRHAPPASAAANPSHSTEDANLQARLDEELENLD